jgi:LysR family hydrogen peroxide-inducible transcriptional activator
MPVRRHAPHSFTLRQLQYALAVAEELSFRRAARQCGVSQPSLSAQLAQLERALGTRLFERGRGKVIVTSAGRAVVERAAAVLREADDVVTTARRLADPLAGTLTLGVIPTVSPYLLPSATRALRKAFPRLRAVWVEDKTEALVRRLHDGQLDAAVLALEADLGDVAHAVIARDPFVLATRKDDPLGVDRAPAHLGELREAEVLLLDDGHCFREQALAYCTRARARELELRATSLPTLAQMVAGGIGVTLLPAIAVTTEAARAGLRVRPFAEPAPHRTIALAWRKRSPLGPSLSRLAATIRDAYPAKAPVR